VRKSGTTRTTTHRTVTVHEVSRELWDEMREALWRFNKVKSGRWTGARAVDFDMGEMKRGYGPDRFLAWLSTHEIAHDFTTTTVARWTPG
jgi:hypothetical protein